MSLGTVSLGTVSPTPSPPSTDSLPAIVGFTIPLALIGIVVIAIFLRWAIRVLLDRGVVQLVRASAAQRRIRTRVAGATSDGELAQEEVRAEARIRSAASLIKNVVSFAVLGVAAVLALAIVGVNVAPILASAGILGIAIGFGAQSLVKDFLTGVFMIMEDQFGVGDVVDVGLASGTVERVGLRMTRIRDGDGVIWYVPNGGITRVGNRSKGWSTAVIDVPVAYGEDLERVRQILLSELSSAEDDPVLAAITLDDDPLVALESMSLDSVAFVIRVKCLPGQSVDMARALRPRLAARLEAEGIASRPGSPTEGPAGGPTGPTS